MSHTPLDPKGDVSVVIVHYRTPSVLAECLSSIEEHMPDRVGQVTVVDNSADGTISALTTQFPWVDFLINDKNVHFRRANNQAVRRTRLPYVLLLNPDTRVVDRHSIARLAGVLDLEPTAGMVGPMMRGDDGRLAPQGESVAGLLDLIHRRPPARDIQIDPSLHAAGFVETVSAAALMCRRDDFQAVGGFDERVQMYWEEHELARKFRRRGLRAYYEPASFIYHRWRRGGSEILPDATILFHQSERLYYRQFFGLRGRTLTSFIGIARGTARRLRTWLQRKAGDQQPDQAT